MATLEEFMNRFAGHIVIPTVSGVSALGLEKMAKSFHNQREDEPTLEAKEEMGPVQQRKYQDMREKASLAWLWAASSSLVVDSDKEKFTRLLARAADEFMWEEPHETGALLEHVQETADLFRFLEDDGNRERACREASAFLKMKIPRFYALGGEFVEYISDERNEMLASHAVEFVVENRHLLGSHLPSGTSGEELLAERSRIAREKEMAKGEYDQLSIPGKVRRAISHTMEIKRMTEQITKVEAEIAAYDPRSDINVYRNMDGVASLQFGDYLIDFFDLLVPGNRRNFEFRAWEAGKNGENGVKVAVRDLAIAAEPSKARRADAIYGTCPVAFDSDAASWGFIQPYDTHPGIYRRNAVGAIISK